MSLPMVRSGSGFTFNEVLFAIAAIAIAVLGLSITTIGVIRGNKANDNFAAALNLAQDKMEQLKAAASLVVEDRCPAAGDNGITGSGAAGGIFDRCWTVSPSALGAHLMQVDVTVAWREVDTHRITLSSLMFVDGAL